MLFDKSLKLIPACSCISGSTQVTIHAVEVSADPKSPRFGAGPREDAIGLYVDWAVEDSGLCKGDRFVLSCTVRNRESSNKRSRSCADEWTVILTISHSDMKSTNFDHSFQRYSFFPCLFIHLSFTSVSFYSICAYDKFGKLELEL